MIHENDTHNFEYVTLVTDMNTEAETRAVSKYNRFWEPSTYADGGLELFIGGGDQAIYESMFASVGARPVEDVGVILHTTWMGGGDLQIDLAFAHGTPVNTVTAPLAPTGPAELVIGSSGNFTATGTDAEGDSLWYTFIWGDGKISDWTGPYASGEPCVLSHTYINTGSFSMTVLSKDYFHQGDTSLPASINVVSCCLERGDVDYTLGPGGPVDVSDLTYLVAFLFTGGPEPPCIEAGNVDSIVGPAGPIDVSDLTYLVAFLFTGGTPPPPC